MTDMFHGAKIALLCGDRLIAYRRDDKPDIPNPGLWDLLGGGREGDETPTETALREVQEEFGLRLDPACVSYARRYPSVDHPGHQGWFLAGTVSEAEVATIRFGDEGQEWAMLRIADFLERADVVLCLRRRLATFLQERPA